MPVRNRLGEPVSRAVVFLSLLWYHRGMREHRIRLNDEDIALIVAALTARAGMARGARLHRVNRLVARLSECQRGNPQWLLDGFTQAHEEELSDWVIRTVQGK